MAKVLTELQAEDVFKRPPDVVDDDLVMLSPRLVWVDVETSKLAWIDEPRLRRLSEKSGGMVILALENSDAKERIWSSQDFDSAEEAIANLPKDQTLQLVVEIADRSGLGNWLRGEASALIRIVPILTSKFLVGNLSLLNVRAKTWGEIGVDFSRFTVLVDLLGETPRVRARLIQVCPSSLVMEALQAATSAKSDLETACRVERCRRERSDLPLPSMVTPLHFQLRTGPSEGSAEQQCERIATELALAYLADRIVLGPPTRMTFRGYRPTEIKLPSKPRPESSSQGVSALCDSVEWSCDDRYSDRLEVLQRLISLRLTDDATRNYEEVLTSASRIFEAAKENWQVFLGQATQTYFERQKELGDYLSAKVAQYSARLETLIKGLSGYGITLLGFLFTDYFARQGDPAVALASRHSIASAFFYYSLVILAVIFGHAVLEEVLLGKELADERSRLGKFFGDDELKNSVDQTIRRRKNQFRIPLVILMVLAAFALFLFFRHVEQTYGGLRWWPLR